MLGRALSQRAEETGGEFTGVAHKLAVNEFSFAQF